MNNSNERTLAHLARCAAALERIGAELETHRLLAERGQSTWPDAGNVAKAADDLSDLAEFLNPSNE